jgi:tetratricopeptide (TPR) repeat protein
LAAANPAFLPDLAGALNNLGNHYGEVGRRAEAVAPSEEAVDIYQDLAEANSAFLPNLATALNNLGNRYGEVGRRAEAVAPTEEAVALRRDLAAANPAFLPDLATALNNLGIRYGEVGRRAEAVAPTEEAVDIYRDLAAANSAFLPDLATVLNNLGNCYSEVGRPGAADAIWQGVLSELPPDARPYLLLSRAAGQTVPSRAGIRWLVSTLALAGDDPALIRAAHDVARRYRSADHGQVDTAWSDMTGELPAWLTADPDLLDTADAWINTPTYTAERDHLAAHPELLTPAADTAIDEALLNVGAPHADRYRRLRQDARTGGVDAAYQPLLLTVLAGEFITADLAGQQALLHARRDELRSELLRQMIREARSGPDADPAAVRAACLLTLADGGDDDAVFAALTDPDRFPPLLNALSHRANGAALAAAATLAIMAAPTDTAQADAAAYLAAATAIDGDADHAHGILDQARRAAPDRVTVWIGWFADIGARHPAVLPLITHLATAPADDPGADH